jgi:carnosine N-methyltransferase
MDFDDDHAERRHFGDVVLSLAEYVTDVDAEWERRMRALASQADARASFGEDAQARLNALRACGRANQDVLDRVVEPYADHVRERAKELGENLEGAATLSSKQSLSKARSTLHQIAREWSNEGAQERAVAFGRIVEQLERRLPENARVAVPGAGLGRLAVEIASKGFRCEGSEFSYQMLLTGDWIMNKLTKSNECVCHPWIDQPSNVWRFQDHVRAVPFPDVCCGELLATPEARARLSMSAGEFCDVYSRAQHESAWDAVVCCFFLDTAANVLEYLRVIRFMLRPGGIFISFGPLLWHFQPEHGGARDANDDERFFRSVEFAYEDVTRAMQSMGFELKLEQIVPDCRYACNVKSMMRTSFDCAFFVAEKRT